MPITSAEHYAHYRDNRKTIDGSSLRQRRRNLKAAVELLELLFLGPPPHEPEIPVEEQDQAIMLRFGEGGNARSYTSQQAAWQLVGEFTRVLAGITDAQAQSDEWLRENMETAYAQYKKIENLFGKTLSYNK